MNEEVDRISRRIGIDMSLKLFGSKYNVEMLIWQRFFGCSDKEVDNLAHTDT